MRSRRAHYTDVTWCVRCITALRCNTVYYTHNEVQHCPSNSCSLHESSSGIARSAVSPLQMMCWSQRHALLSPALTPSNARIKHPCKSLVEFGVVWS
jgi:hypothetical protein